MVSVEDSVKEDYAMCDVRPACENLEKLEHATLGHLWTDIAATSSIIARYAHIQNSTLSIIQSPALRLLSA